MDFRTVKRLIIGDEENGLSRVMEMHSGGDMVMPGLGETRMVAIES